MNNRQQALWQLPFKASVLAVAACFSVGANAAAVDASALDVVLKAGSATFDRTGNVLTITNSNGTILDWQRFNIAAGETRYFLQSSASSSVMNRVLGGDPSSIYGTLASNGRVWLINPAGIVVGATGRIDTAGFIASTLNVRAEDFLAGRLRFEATPGAGNVDIQSGGQITTPSGGTVYLVGANVSNEGIITTPQGETILAAGATVSLIDSGTPGVKVDITGSQGNATNLGTITAEAGRIGIAGVIVKNSGTLNASSVVSDGGRIFLKASQDAYVDGNGRIVATGTKGGQVDVLGQHVAVMDNASIDVSGEYGGGTIRVGGDYQGRNPEIQNASVTYFGPNASLTADATEVGAGGTVIVWADDTTRAYGSISARGGAVGGNGGFVETSGHRWLDSNGARVDTRAVNGKVGQWLLDPDSINLVAGYGSDVLGGGSYTSGIFSGGTGVATMYGDNLISALTTTDVVLAADYGATSSITVGAGTYSFNSIHSLSLYARGDITVNGSLMNSGSGDINMIAGWNANFVTPGMVGTLGNIELNNATVETTSGAMKILAAGLITLNGASAFRSGGASQWIEAKSGALSLYSNGSGSASIEYSGTGTQTVYGASINVYGSTAGGASYGATISSSGTGSRQTVAATAGNLTLYGGGYLVPNSNNGAAITANGLQTIRASNAIILRSGINGGNYNDASIRSDGSQSLTASSISLYGGASSSNSAYFSAGTDMVVKAGNLTLKGGTAADTYMRASNNMHITVAGDIRLNSAGLLSGDDMFLTLNGTTSKIYLNDTAGNTNHSLVISDYVTREALTTHVNFTAAPMSLVIDGVAITTEAGLDALSGPLSAGSGFFNVDETVATNRSGSGRGLDIKGKTIVDGGVINEIVTNSIVTAINQNKTDTAGSTNLPLTFTTSGSTGMLMDPSMTVGGEVGTFGGDDTALSSDDKGSNDGKDNQGGAKHDSQSKKSVGQCKA